MTSTKPVLVMIHGFRGTHHGLALIARELRNDFDVRLPDLPGFAAGPVLNDYSLDSYVDWLKQYIQTSSKDRTVYLLGHSFGSIICSAYMAKHPDKIKKLILVNPIGAPALEGPRRIMTQFAIWYYQVGALLPNKLARKWLSSNVIVMAMSISMAKTKSKSLRKYIHHQHRKYFSRFLSPKSLLDSFETSINYSVRDFAADINKPVLLIAGERDDITPLNKQIELEQLFKNSNLEVIEGVGHLTHYETPKAVADLIKDFTLDE